MVRAGGAAALRPYLDGAVDVLDRKLQILEERGYLASAEGIRKAVDGLLPTLRATLDPMLRDIYLSRVAERTGVRRETLEAELAAEEEERGARPAPGSHQGSGRHVRGTRPGQGLHGSSSWDLADERGEAAQDRAEERKLLFLMLRDESRIPAVAETLAPELITSPVYRELFEELVRTGGLQGRGPLALELSAEARAKL